MSSHTKKTVSLAKVIVAIEAWQVVFNKEQLSHWQDINIHRLAPLGRATSDCLTFLAKSSHAKALATTQAAAVIVGQAMVSDVPKDSLAIVVADPYLAYASVSVLFERLSCEPSPSKPFKQSNGNTPKIANRIHATAVIADNAQIGRDVCIGAYSVVGDGVVIGDDCVLGVGVVIGDGVVIGSSVRIDSHAVIYHGCVIGDDCCIHAHASIGADGFGFAPIRHSNPNHTNQPSWQRIAQLGRVVIGKRVRIGANTCIDRGSLDDTVIGDDVIIDNLVQIAHNVKIGQGSAIAAKTGIAGSTTIGKGCMIGGAVGIAGHLTIADGVVLTGRTFVAKSIHQAGSYSSGTVAMPTATWRRAAVKFRQLGSKNE